MIHKITRQYIKQYCDGDFSNIATRLFILDLIVNEILTNSSNYFQQIDIRTDMYLYDIDYANKPAVTYPIERCYVLKDLYSGFYLYFFCTSYAAISSICFTTSKEYNNTKNVLRQTGSPKIFGRTKAVDKGIYTPNIHKYECYGFLLLLTITISNLDDIYYVTNGRSFSIIINSSFDLLGRYDNETASYFTYDISSPYPTYVTKPMWSIHSSGYAVVRTGASQQDVLAILDHYCETFDLSDTLYICVCLTYVSCDTFDSGVSGYYFSLFGNLITEADPMHRNIDKLYVCDSDVELLETNKLAHLNTPGISITTNRKDYPGAIPHVYEEPDMNFMFVGAMISYFDGYTLLRKYQTPTAAEIMYRTNDDFNYLDINSGTNYYSGMLSTLDNSTVAIPNFVSVLREPILLGTMSPVQESTFMYLIDMSSIKTGDIVRVVDNSGNKIKLICFPTHIGEIVPPGDKMFGMGLKLEDEFCVEDYFDANTLNASKKDKNKELKPLLNTKTGVRAYLGDVDFTIYFSGTILLTFSYKHINTMQIEYTNGAGTYVKNVTWERDDFMDRMASGAIFDLLRQNDDGDFWLVDPRRSNKTLLACNNKNCGIVSITCTRRK